VNRLLPFVALLALTVSNAREAQLTFVFTSDAHYGLARASFRGGHDVDAHAVNAAMVARINSLPSTSFPKDGGLGATGHIGGIDFVAEGGDIANREELTGQGQIQSAAESWKQFTRDYIDGLTVRDTAGHLAPLFVVPGNHDASNAVGFYTTMAPLVDPSAAIGIYNLMMKPDVPKTPATYNYERDRVLTSRDLGGLHLVFLNLWADSVAREWMTSDLARVAPSTPIVIFTHDEPDAEAKHFTNPNGHHDVNAQDRFENLLRDTLADGAVTGTPTTIEQRELERFLRAHPNIVAWFHGNSNWNQFYDWTGPDHTIALHTFRVDSPMKGAISAQDETKLSFQVAIVDTTSRTMTVRECLWNADPAHPDGPLAWGGSVTVALNREH